MTKSSSPATVRSVPGRIASYAMLILAGIVFFAPIYWLFSSALKESSKIYQYPPNWVPTGLRFENFGDAWQAAPFGQFLINSVIVTVVGATIKLINASLTAYALTYIQFPAKNVIFVILLGSLMVPGNVTLIANYITMSNLNWINTYAGIILPSAGSIFGMFLLRQYFLSLPRDVFDSARIDGAGHLRTMRSVILPMSTPMVVTAGLIACIDMWNEFIWPLIVTNTVDMRTLPIGLVYLKNIEGKANWGAIMAGTVIVVLPMVVLFVFAQRKLVAGLTDGSMKG